MLQKRGRLTSSSQSAARLMSRLRRGCWWRLRCGAARCRRRTSKHGADADRKPANRGLMVLEENSNRVRASKADGWMERGALGLSLLGSRLVAARYSESITHESSWAATANQIAGTCPAFSYLQLASLNTSTSNGGATKPRCMTAVGGLVA